MRSLSINDERVCLALLEPSKHQGYGGGNINNNGNIMMMIIWREFLSRPLCLPRVAAQIDRIAAMAGQWPQPEQRMAGRTTMARRWSGSGRMDKAG